MVSCVCIAFNLVACPSIHSRRFCPQHNILWDDLTVKEHMDIYAELKGLDPETREEECLALIVAVGLSQKKDKRSKSLSGGMKRKLSLAIALMGQNTKVSRGRGQCVTGSQGHSLIKLKWMDVAKVERETPHVHHEC